MKKINYIIPAFLCLLIIGSACNEPITEFGFDGGIYGKIVDQSGNIVAGDITSGGFIVNALGEEDEVAMIMRVKGDGTFANLKLFPKKYTVRVEGPVFPIDEVAIDLTGNQQVEHNFTVTPFLTIAPPTLNGTPTATEIKVNYSITENNGKTASTREVYCSNIPYPNASTGSGPYYSTVKVTLSANSGVATITGLQTGTRYFIRVGAKANGASAFNYSDQLIVTTP
jgi:hypothetical protein